MRLHAAVQHSDAGELRQAPTRRWKAVLINLILKELSEMGFSCRLAVLGNMLFNIL